MLRRKINKPSSREDDPHQKDEVEEERLLEQCLVVLSKMKAVTIEQRNIYMDIKNNIIDVEELLGLITYQRNSLKKTEKERRKKQNASGAPNEL